MKDWIKEVKTAPAWFWAVLGVTVALGPVVGYLAVSYYMNHY